MVKKIVINGRFLTRKITGVERYSIELIKELDNLIENGVIDNDTYSISILCPSNRINNLEFKNIKIKTVGKLKGQIWEQFELPLYCKDALLFSPCNIGPLFKRNQIVTIHDASVFAFPETYSKFFILWYRFLYKVLKEISKKIITVSKFSSDELIKYCKISKSKVIVIYEGKEQFINLESDNSIIEHFNLTNKSFILAVSSLNKNKNFQSIIKALNIIDNKNFEVAIAGNINNKVFKDVGIDIPDYIKKLGYVTDSQLKSLYENTSCFLYPSFYEGFGLPPLEAMACGAPVIASQTSSIPEVCGEAALYCDPYDYKDLAEKIKIVMNNENLRENMKNQSLEQAKKFTWEKAALETFNVMKECI